MPLSVYGEESAVIPISNAEELARIGTDASYPMDGDYELTADIQLEGNWMPFGGYMGWKGSCNPADANVFSGTFDGKGHVISGLDIRLEGSIEGEKYGQVGLFSIIGSDRADDFAEVKNLIFSNVSVSVDFSNELAAVGTLAGEVNGYARVSNVVVVSGKITVNPSKSCDTVGAGGIVGECRTSGAMGNGNISITDCYNGADRPPALPSQRRLPVSRRPAHVRTARKAPGIVHLKSTPHSLSCWKLPSRYPWKIHLPADCGYSYGQ